MNKIVTWNWKKPFHLRDTALYHKNNQQNLPPLELKTAGRVPLVQFSPYGQLYGRSPRDFLAYYTEEQRELKSKIDFL